MSLVPVVGKWHISRSAIAVVYVLVWIGDEELHQKDILANSARVMDKD